jgi:hypothetical protein
MDGEPMVDASWSWGLLFIGLTMAIHATGVVVMALVLLPIRHTLQRREFGHWCVVPAVLGVLSAVGLMLGTLHGLEAASWAMAYVWLGAFQSHTDAMLYSLGAMTTAGVPGLALPGQWRMMGALESTCGMLLFGISTAYIFGLMQVYWPMLPGHR